MHEFDGFNEDIICAITEAVGEDNVALVEPMSAHTTFHIGGPADVLVTPTTPEAIVRTLDLAAISGTPVTVVGNGSDLLVGDRGIRGLVLLLRENYSDIQVEGARVTAEAGALLADVAEAAANAGLTGMEPISGIPASVGGACFMNAGAYDGSTGEVLESVEVYVPFTVSTDALAGSSSSLQAVNKATEQASANKVSQFFFILSKKICLVNKMTRHRVG